jgi:DNA-binding XRE family transcriptional regulator
VRRDLIDRRVELSMSQEKLAAKVGVSVRTIIRWEQGGAIRVDQRQALATALEWSLARLALALAGEGDADAVNGHSVPTNLTLLASLEQGASEIRTCQTVVVPGLLQTEAYAFEVEGLGPIEISAQEIARGVQQRLMRQRVLDRLRLLALIDASVLVRETGGAAVMAAQLDHLHAMVTRPNIEIRVLPFDGRAHAAARGAFHLLTSPDAEIPFVAITEDAAGVRYLDEQTAVAAHLELWEHLWRISDELEKIELQRTKW